MAQLATIDGEQPFINSNLFVYDEAEHAVYMHTARHGRTRANVDGGERVCLSVSEMGRLLPSDRAFSMSVEYAGVVIFGMARAIEDDAEKERVLLLLVRKYFPHLQPGADFATPDAGELKLTSAYHIRIDEWSGKRKQAEAGVPRRVSLRRGAGPRVRSLPTHGASTRRHVAAQSIAPAPSGARSRPIVGKS